MTISLSGGRPWPRAALWLAGLGPFFFASYGFATWVTARREHVGAVVFAWEQVIPFVPWTIVPYWSIDILYGISLFICATRAELDMHAKRLLTAQIIAVSCFLLFPLTFTFPRPDPGGVSGLLFTALGQFDKPFNQAPSLHVGLLVILWDRFAHHTPANWKWLLHSWFGLIGVSVLTTYQHHFVDIPTGAWLGFLCLWLWPETGPTPLRAASWTRDAKRRLLARRYALGGALLAGLALWPGGFALWLLWPAGSCLLVAANYALFGAAGFQKTADGALSPAVRWLLGPYLLAARINALLWTRGTPPMVAIVDGVSLGRWPSGGDLPQGIGVVDLTAEMPRPARLGGPYHGVPMLDLIVPERADLLRAVDSIEQARAAGPVLVCCALGYGRSAASVLAWLLHTGRAVDFDAAATRVRQARPRMIVNDHVRRAVLAATGPGA